LHCAIALALPADCLLYGELRDVQSLCERGGAVLGRLDGQSDSAALRARIGESIHSPTLAGIDLTAPAHFWLLDPHKYPAPWVYAFRPANVELFEAGLEGWYADTAREGARDAHAARPPLTAARRLGYRLRVADRLLLCSDLRAGMAVAQWLQQEMRRAKPELQLRCTGQITLRLDLKRILAVYEKEYAAHVEAMKGRMREAIERLGHRPDAEAGIVAAQKELDRFAGLVRDLADVDIAFRMEPDSATLLVDAQAATGSILDRAVRAHPRGASALLERCPAEAMLTFYTNLSAAEAIGNMALRALGSNTLELLKQTVAPESSMLVALLMSPAPERIARVLELRDGVTAAGTWARWDRFAVIEGRPVPVGVPFILRPEPLPAGAPPETRLAAVQLDEKALGVAATRALARLFGSTPRVALRFAEGRSLAAAAADPLPLLARIEELAAKPEQALATDASLRRTLAGLPPAPNVLFYAAPTGVRAWLALGGFTSGPPLPGELGFAGVLSLTEQGRLIGALRLPTAALQEALAQRK
jgi:hypothetical protein